MDTNRKIPMKTKYIADDNQIFANEKDCARHELANCEGVLAKLEEGIAKEPRGHQMNWCGGQACGCMVALIVSSVNYPALKDGASFLYRRLIACLGRSSVTTP